MSLGVQKGTVKLAAHNPEWETLFEQEKQLLQDTVGDTIIAIEHVGSTAIPDIPAKPILDMNIAVNSLDIVPEMKQAFEQLGYEYRGKRGVEDRELFVKGPIEKRTHHVHVTLLESKFWNDLLVFRDYLRSHPEVAQKYAILKQELANKYKDDRYTYTEKKKDFIEKILAKAK